MQGDDHCPDSDGHSISDACQDAIGPLGHLGTLLAQVQLLSANNPRQHQRLFWSHMMCEIDKIEGPASQNTGLLPELDYSWNKIASYVLEDHVLL
ncbi:hypothetical protein BTVI_104329 [Pitangus sulphuratus]|nr:hypothetical protein BTVI_104329 [Pitangus sulphuratus]